MLCSTVIVGDEILTLAPMNNAFLFNQLCTFKWNLADMTLKAKCVKDAFYKSVKFSFMQTVMADI